MDQDDWKYLEAEWPPNVVRVEIEGRGYTLTDGQKLTRNRRTQSLVVEGE